jgi:hypothetical protein
MPLAKDLCPSTVYDPEQGLHRRALALQLQAALNKAGFAREHGTRHQYCFEEVWARQPHEKIAVAIYTTIEDGAVRGHGTDAIRVVAFWRGVDGCDRPITKSTRTFRVGTLDAIVTRTLDRARDVWQRAARPQRCRSCGAPTFVSKKGNSVCADLCFKRGKNND